VKIILGDNQFFGINHYDLKKGNKSKKIFGNTEDIKKFIKDSLEIGLDGFMINSNKIGYELISGYNQKNNEEIHYSVPYPHKYASIVNESGMLYLLKYFIQRTSIFVILKCIFPYIFTRNLKYLIPLAVNLEIPKNLKRGSAVYLQNIITDLVLGLKKVDFLEEFVKYVRSKGYKPGLITLNPILLDKVIEKSEILNEKDLIICFNINISGFNVFPNKTDVINFLSKNKNYKRMGMSIFSSGGGNIADSISFIKKLELDYIVFGSSKLKNIRSNYNSFKT